MKPRSRDIAKLEKRLRNVEEPVSEVSSSESETEKKEKKEEAPKLPVAQMKPEEIADMHKR